LTQNPGLLLTIAAFLLVLGPLVFVHELGHYLAGRMFGIKADVFSVGFGREIFGVTDKRGTRWKFAWLPLGGYVKFAGDMNPASQPSAEWLQLPPAERAKTFQSKPIWQRAIVVFAGPFVNFLLAIVILGGFAVAYGESRTPNVAGTVLPDSAAQKAGLQAGDRITAIDGRQVVYFDDLARHVSIRPGESTTLTVERGGDTLTLPATIGERHESDRFGNDYRIGLLGIAPGTPIRVSVPLIEAPVVGIKRTASIVTMMVDTLGQVITGRRSVQELGGPIKIAQVAGQQLSLGWTEFVWLVAMISINLGFINLLPVPILDGGHLLLYAVEAVRRRPVGPQVQEWAFRGGLAMILALMLLVTFNDLVAGFAG
jgi:regulator of sigma E protease